GTSEGLDCIEKDTLTVQHISFGDNLPTPYISAVTGDGKGNIWISHKKGISKLHMPEREVSTYNIRDKNGNWIFLDGARYKDSSTNSIYFGARTGYVSFNPEKIKTNPFAPELALKSLYVSGKPVIPGDTIRGQVVLQKLLSRTKSIDLKYVNRNFSVEMAAMHYETPGDNMFMYKLEGYDDNWTKTTRNLITYNRIPPGNYIYRAKAISPDALFSLEKDLIIHVHAPWYASFWALSGYVVFILLILLLIYREILSRERLKSQVQLERLKMDKQEELNRDKLEFFTNVSHELRTPLTLIADPLKQLEEKKMPENKQKQYIKVINKNVRQLTELINQLLDFRKAEAGKLTVNYSVCNALKIIRKAAESFSLHAKQRNIQLSIQAEISRVSGYFDQEKLKQVMMNLISNAFKYTPDGGEVSVNISEQCSNGAAELIVIVKDTGIGISPDSLNKIFEPFNNEGSKPFYGNSSGMGMALTHYLVNIMDGQITAESIPGKGTKIILKLPFTRSHAISDAEINNTRDAIYKNVLIESEGNSYLKTSKPTILIVEDNEDLQEYLATELSPEYMLLQEYNGEKGLISAIEMVPDLVVSDVMMPGMDGTQLCKSLKKDEKTSHIPIILLTAKTAEESQIEGLQTGADVYITKPFSVEVLKAQIESMIENRMLLQQKLARIIRIEALETESPQIENVFLKKIVKIIHTHIDSDNFGPEQLADILQISQRQLYRKLKAVSGSTVHEFITRVRMDHAAKLLLDSSLNISEIAYRTGFSEPSNFSRTFSRHFRMSPTQYQKRKRNGN
ncbi:MAG TPA: hybrid sensor histidine kinase/response regulator transcription factor, partial [Bacteroidales bacterium]|nr:hybrid sensor histidine kinase/response regulator transcription factor [Bacteroidales bacterium]